VPRRADLPTYLSSPVERGAVAAELEALAETIETTDPGPNILERARANRLRDWAKQTSNYGNGSN
jgi:hypothetical protein